MPALASPEWLEGAASSVIALSEPCSVTVTIEGSPVAKKVSWHEVHTGDGVELAEGTLKGADLVLTAKWKDWTRLLDGEVSAAAHFMQGRLKVAGDDALWLRILPDHARAPLPCCRGATALPMREGLVCRRLGPFLSRRLAARRRPGRSWSGRKSCTRLPSSGEASSRRCLAVSYSV